MRVTAANIVKAIAKLPKDRAYDYVHKSTTTKIMIDNVTRPEGPIIIRRYNPNKGEGIKNAKEYSISTNMIWRVANAIAPGHPINIDRMLGASYNTRSAFEALLAHTPEFYYCYPGRIESISSNSKIRKGHKHLIWKPNEPHAPGVTEEAEVDIVISEGTKLDVVYDALVLPEYVENVEIDIDIQRRHAQMQVALVKIGEQLGYRTWVAQNDKGIIYEGKRIGEMENVVDSLRSENVLSVYNDAIRYALLIDCIWFRSDRMLPAVIEIEHSTGVRSGLMRMKNLYDQINPYPTRYVIVAPDEERSKVLRESSLSQFKDMNPKFFPYSAVEELYALCQKRKICGVYDEFLDCFMEPAYENH